jgi:hypothetical protein
MSCPQTEQQTLSRILPNRAEEAARGELDSRVGKQTDTAWVAARRKLLEFAIVLREWDRAEKGRSKIGNVD